MSERHSSCLNITIPLRPRELPDRFTPHSRPQVELTEQIHTDGQIMPGHHMFQRRPGVLTAPERVGDLQLPMSPREHRHHRVVSLDDAGEGLSLGDGGLRREVTAAHAKTRELVLTGVKTGDG